MPNWTTINGVDATVPFGQPAVLDTTYITIVPDPGYTITPNNFVIGGAVNIGGKWVGGNVSPAVSFVEFSQSGDNVLATVTCNEVAYTGDTTLTIDIDESATNPVAAPSNDIVVLVDYPYDANLTVAFTLGDDVVEETVQTGSAGVNWIKKFSLNKMDLVDFELFKMTATPGSGYHLGNDGVVLEAAPSQRIGLGATIATSPSSGEISFRYTQTNGNIDLGLNPPTLLTSFSAVADQTAATNHISSVSVTPSLHMFEEEAVVSVSGIGGTQYKIFVRNTTTGNYYNWDGTWTAAPTNKVGTLNTAGAKSHVIPIDSTSSTRSFDVYVASHNGSTLADTVPDAQGELQFTQYGQNVLSIEPVSDDAGRYQTLPAAVSVSRPIRFTGDKYPALQGTKVAWKGQTSGSSTRVELVDGGNGLQPGMQVYGENIPHETTIINAVNGIVTLSGAVTLDGTEELTGALDNANLIPFSFTIEPNGNDLEVNSSNDHYKSLYGWLDVWTTCRQTTISGGTTIPLKTAQGILEGMTITGNGVPANTVVSAVSYKNREVTASNTLGTLTVNDAYDFKGANNPDGSTAYVFAEEVSNDIVISGYLNVPKLKNTAKLKLFVDDIINVV